jgi:hypothetical protein
MPLGSGRGYSTSAQELLAKQVDTRRVRTLRLLLEISLPDSLISSRDKFSRAPTSATARIRTSSRIAWQANLLRNETII